MLRPRTSLRRLPLRSKPWSMGLRQGMPRACPTGLALGAATVGSASGTGAGRGAVGFSASLDGSKAYIGKALDGVYLHALAVFSVAQRSIWVVACAQATNGKRDGTWDLVGRYHWSHSGAAQRPGSETGVFPAAGLLIDRKCRPKPKVVLLFYQAPGAVAAPLNPAMHDVGGDRKSVV